MNIKDKNRWVKKFVAAILAALMCTAAFTGCALQNSAQQTGALYSQDLVNFKNSVPNLGFVYSDVFSGGSWKGRRLAEDYKAAGLAYCVEWPYQNEAEAVWAHWAVEKPYSPANNKGYVSDIARFIFNHTKERFTVI